MIRPPLPALLAALLLLPGFSPGRSLAAPATDANSPRVAALCRKMDAAWAGVRTFQANLKWPNPASKLEAEQGCGLFLFQRPDHWMMEFHTPRYEKYVVKGDTGMVYIQRLKQAMRYRLGPEDRAQVGLLVLGQPTTALARFYNLGADPTPADRAALADRGPGLVLTPRNPGSLGLRRAVVFVDPVTSLPRKVRLQLESGEDMRITLENPGKNQPLRPSVWYLGLPEGTTVIDR